MMQTIKRNACLGNLFSITLQPKLELKRKIFQEKKFKGKAKELSI